MNKEQKKNTVVAMLMVDELLSYARENNDHLVDKINELDEDKEMDINLKQAQTEMLEAGRVPHRFYAKHLHAIAGLLSPLLDNKHFKATFEEEEAKWNKERKKQEEEHSNGNEI